MGKNFLCLSAMLVMSMCLFAQLNDSFSDGNFTSNPAWTGNAADWQVAASSDVASGAPNSSTLRLNVAAGAGATYICTQVAGSWGLGQSWGFFIGRRGQAYTAANQLFIWLWASETDLRSPTINGYRIKLGDDAGGDEIVLQKVAAGIATDLLSGSTALNNGLTDIGFLLRVSRSSTGTWEVFTSVLPTANGSGAIASDVPSVANTPLLQGSVTDNTYPVLDNGSIGFVNAYGSGTAARAAQEFDQVQLSFVNQAMPVSLLNFSAAEVQGRIKLIWEVATESNVKEYMIESSRDGSAFKPIGSIAATSKNSYSFIDGNSGHYTSFYRLKIIDADGSFAYSNIAGLRKASAASLKIRQAAGIVIIEHPPARSAIIQLLTVHGRLIHKEAVSGNATTTMLGSAALPPGGYCVLYSDSQTGYRSLSRLFTSLSSR